MMIVMMMMIIEAMVTIPETKDHARLNDSNRTITMVIIDTHLNNNKKILFIEFHYQKIYLLIAKKQEKIEGNRERERGEEKKKTPKPN